MISKFIESFVTELQKDENQEYINDIINPYIYIYKYYLFLISFIIFILTLATLYNTYILHKYIKC